MIVHEINNLHVQCNIYMSIANCFVGEMSKRWHPEPNGSVQSTKVAKRPGRQGIRLTSQSKYIVMNVRKFFEEEKRTGKSKLRERVLDRTATATGISRTTIQRIRKTLTTDEHFLTPIKRYITSRIRINPDSFDREAIRQTLHTFYDQRKYLTLTTLLETVRQKGIFSGGRLCLWRVVKEMGFTYKQQTIHI